jgi:hypothetical protein
VEVDPQRDESRVLRAGLDDEAGINDLPGTSKHRGILEMTKGQMCRHTQPFAMLMIRKLTPNVSSVLRKTASVND